MTMRLWQIAALLAAGLIVGQLAPGMLTESFRALTLVVFLPALIFEGAWGLDFALMRRAWRPIVLLAIPGVALTAIVVAVAVQRFGNVGFGTALLIGAILSATDPVAVVAIFRRLRVPRGLAVVVESEALLNDAVAVVLYRAVLAAVFGGASLNAIERVSAVALLGSVGGIVLGAVIGWFAAVGLRKRNASALQSAVTIVVAYGSYLLADSLHCSGIFAVIACAIVLRELERRWISLDVARNVERTWAAIAVVANVLLFFTIGAAVEIGSLRGELRLVLVTLAAVLLARAMLAYGLLALAGRMQRSWKAVVRLAGVRGALSLALALAVPARFPDRALVIDAAFAVVIVTILIGALTLDRRIERLEL